jgi:hypothetical protein
MDSSSSSLDLSNIMKPEICSQCRFAVKDGPDLSCRRSPPHGTVLMVPAPPPRTGQLMPQVLTSFPIVRSDMWCGEFSRRVGAS